MHHATHFILPCTTYTIMGLTFLLTLSLSLIIVKSSVDSPDQLGSMFGLQQTFSSVARGIAPTFVSTLFAFSIDRQVMGGYFVWVVLTFISLLAVPISMRVRDLPAPRSMTDLGDDNDEGGNGDHHAIIKPASQLAVHADEAPSSRSPSH